MYKFLTVEEITAEQLRQLEKYGGGFNGIINPETVESACYAPQATFGGEYLYEDVYTMATAYLVSFVKGHAFANGNKRIGLASALEFLYVNGIVIDMSNDEAVALVLDVISGARRAPDAADCLKTHAQPLTDNIDRSLKAAIEWVHQAYAQAFEVLAQ